MYGYLLNSRYGAGRRSLTRCLNRLRAINARVISTSNENSFSVDVDHILAGADALEALLQNQEVVQSIWAYENTDELLEVVSSYALALRRSAPNSGASAAERDAFWRLRAAMTSHLACFKSMWRVISFSLDKYMMLTTSLVRSQALRCYSALLADCATKLASLPVAALPAHSHTGTVGLLREVCDMLEALVSPVEKPNPGYDVVLAEMCKELISSRLLEHWSRTLLLLYLSRSQGPPPENELALLAERMGVILSLQGGLCRDSLLTMDDHSLGYFLSSHLVRLAAVLDGGTLYGMREESAAPLTPGEPLTDAQGQRMLTQDIVLAQSALSAWYALLVETRMLLQCGVQNLPGPIQAGGSPSLADAAQRRLTHLQQQLEQLDKQLQEADGTAPPSDQWGRACFPQAGDGTTGPPALGGARPAVTASSFELLQHKRDCEKKLARVQQVLKSLAVPPFNLAFTRDLALRLATVALDVLHSDAAGDSASAAAAGGSSSTAEVAAPSMSVPSQQQGAPLRGLLGSRHQRQQRQQAREELVQQLEPARQPQQQTAAAATPQPVRDLQESGSWALCGRTMLQKPQKPRVDQAILLGLKGLMCAREAMWDVGWAPREKTPAPKLAQLADWWRRVAEFGPLIARRGPGMDGNLWRWVELAPLLVLRSAHNPATSTISLSPSADLTVALDYGYLRVVDQLLRRSEGSRGLMVHLIIESNTFPWRQALAHGSSRHVAALLTTIAKVVRRDTIELMAAEGEVEEATAVAVAGGGAKAASWLKRALSRRRDARGQATATMAAATGLMGPEWNVLLIIEYCKLLKKRQREELAAAAAAAAVAGGSVPISAGHQERDEEGPRRGGSGGNADGGAGGSCGGAASRACASANVGRHGAGGGEDAGLGADEGSQDGTGKVDGGEPFAGGGKGDASAGQGSASVGVSLDAASTTEASGGVDASSSSCSNSINSSGCTGAPACNASAAQLSKIISHLGHNLCQMAVRLLPDICELAVRLADATWRDGDPGMLLTHAWVVANTSSFVELMAVIAGAAKGKRAGKAAPARVDTAAPGDGPGRAGRPHGAGRGSAAVDGAGAEGKARGSGREGRMGIEEEMRAAWDQLLTWEVGIMGQLHLTFYLLEVLSTTDMESSGLAKQLFQALKSLAEWAPERLVALVASLGNAQAMAGPGTPGWRAQVKGAGSGPYGLPGPGNLARGLARVRQLMGPRGKRAEPDLLAVVERMCAGEKPVAASSADVGAAGVGVAAAAEGAPEQGASMLDRLRAGWPHALKTLILPAEARALLPVCSNPLCTSLAGDSEAGQRLSGCGRCGGRVRYCCRECQVAHWKAGHKIECEGAAARSGGFGAASVGAVDVAGQRKLT